MTTLKGFKRRLQALDIEKKVPEIIRDTSGTLISLNQKQLFNRGVNKDGEILGTYSLTTEALSNGRKKRGQRYTLFDTGSFYRGFNIKVDPKKITFDSSNYKTSLLEDRLSNKIFGLTNESKGIYIYGPGLFFSKLKAYIESTLKVKFTR